MSETDDLIARAAVAAYKAERREMARRAMIKLRAYRKRLGLCIICRTGRPESKAFARCRSCRRARTAKSAA